MDQESIEPSRAQTTPEDPIAEPPRYDLPDASATAKDQAATPIVEAPQPADAQQAIPAVDAQPQITVFCRGGAREPVAAVDGPGRTAGSARFRTFRRLRGSRFQQPTQPQDQWQHSGAGQASYQAPAGWDSGQPTAWQPNPTVANLPQSQWQPAGQMTQAGPATPVGPLGAGPNPAIGQPVQLSWPTPVKPWHPPLVATADLPPGWHAPLRTDLVPIKPRKRRSKRFILTAAAVVVLLVAGVTTWLVWPPDRSPFEQAVANLAAQPIADYRSDLPDGSQFDGRVTNEGDAAGWLMTSSVTQIKFQFLLVNGKLFVKLNGNLLPPGTARDAFNDAGLQNRWITGDVGELKPLVKQSVTPAAIAGKLRDEVARTEKLPTPSDDGTTIDGVPVLKGDTPDGTLYVAKEQPYRVVRWVDKQTKKAASAFTNPGNKLLLNGERAGYTGLGTADFTPMNADNNDQLYDEMQTDVGQLGDAIDTSVRYTVSSVDNLEHFDDCEAAGCQVVAHFTATTAAGTSPPAEVTTQMSASVTIDDIAAGSCSATTKVATTGTVTMQCLDKDMHGGFTQANDKAEADARAKSGGSGYYFWFLQVRAKVHALALARWTSRPRASGWSRSVRTAPAAGRRRAAAVAHP
ncbi:hypothetical protein [Kutzneria sp. 744]|uniref:hypothetical protein n=1 Tax=Kutzneria sp. (strain 744) TaxID=345341 RepID=UPI0003EEAA96|nr:hypothetical protein [Kutzneria sp. 744]EWM18136.1 PE-PGRS family protein [Kutzneria sp. 744]